MDLLDAATFFDDDPVYDAYTSALLFNAQSMSATSASRSEASIDRKRVLSVAPGIAMPTRRALRIYTDTWLVGAGTTEGFYGVAATQTFSMKRGSDLMAALTPGQVLSGAAGTSLWTHLEYFKDTTDSLSSSELDAYWNIFVAPGEPVAKGTFLKDANNRLYRVRNDYLPVEGLRVCPSDTLDPGALQSVTWGTGTYDPINDAISGGTSVVNAIAFETPKFHRFRFVSDPDLQKGDMAVFVPTSITPKQGDQFTMGSKKWRAVTVQAEVDVWAVHARLV